MSLINKTLKWFMLALALVSGQTLAGRVQLLEDLTEISNLAISKYKAILLMFSATDCPFCLTMEDDFLDPLLINEEETGAIIRKVNINEPGEIIDFDGKKIEMQDFVKKHRVRITPTLLFMDPNGREHTDRILGLMTRDYLGLYIDTKIEVVQRRMMLDKRSKTLSKLK